MRNVPVVVVTGANGYVGSIICRALAQCGRVIPLVRNPNHRDEQAWSFDSSESNLASLLARYDVTQVIHAAWDMKSNDLDHLEHTCVAGTKRLLAAAESIGIARFILISSMSAFAGAKSAYGRSKLLAERSVLDAGGTVLRLGLVWGDSNGGVFGSLANLAGRLPVIPHIAGGVGVQFLLHEESLATAIARAVRGDFADERRVITLAHPTPVPLSELLRALAAARGRRALLVPVPWRAIYIALRVAERLHMPLKIRSDSLLGFVHQDDRPDFTPLIAHQIDMKPFPLLR